MPDPKGFMPDPMSTPIGDGTCERGRLEYGAVSALPRPAAMARRGEKARRGEGTRRAHLPAGHRHGRGNVGARRRRAVLRVRRRARHAQRQPPPGQFLRRQAQEHDARIFHRAVQARAERKFSRQSRRHAQAHPAEIRRHRPGDAERHAGRRPSTSPNSRRRNGIRRTAAAISAPAATTSCATPTTAGSIAAPIGS